jgi:hypothetical protein
VVSFPVQDGCPLELTVARNWNTVGDTAFSMTLNFCGAVPTPSTVIIKGGARVSSLIRLTSHIATVEAAPAGKLEKWTTFIRPSTIGKVYPLGERDVVPSGAALYAVDITYAFEQTDSCSVKPSWPGLNNVLYEVIPVV